MATWSEIKIECCRPHADLQCWMGAWVGAAVYEEGARAHGWMWNSTRSWSIHGAKRIIITPWRPCRFRLGLTTISRTRSKWTGHCSGYGLRRSITMPSAVACFHGGAPLHTVHLQWHTVAAGNSFYTAAAAPRKHLLNVSNITAAAPRKQQLHDHSMPTNYQLLNSSSSSSSTRTTNRLAPASIATPMRSQHGIHAA